MNKKKDTKLAVFRLKADGYRGIMEEMGELCDKCLVQDTKWYFIPSPPNEVILRVSLSSRKVVKLHCKAKMFEYEELPDFEPSQDEYRQVCIYGDALTGLFHETSLIALKYPRELAKTIIERAFHIFLFQVGIFSWRKEAEMFTELALNRAVLYGKYGWNIVGVTE